MSFSLIAIEEKWRYWLSSSNLISAKFYYSGLLGYVFSLEQKMVYLGYLVLSTITRIWGWQILCMDIPMHQGFIRFRQEKLYKLVFFFCALYILVFKYNFTLYINVLD